MRRSKLPNILLYAGTALLLLLIVNLSKSNSNDKKRGILYESEFDKYVDEHCPYELVTVTESCLASLNKYSTDSFKNIKPKEKIVYHTYWHNVVADDQHEFEIMSLHVYSFLAMQDLNYAKLIVWTKLSTDDSKEIKESFGNYIQAGLLEFKVIDLNELCSVYPFKLAFQYCTSFPETTANIFSDFFRLLVLYNYGGIYSEIDTIYLRDMKPFWYTNFLYRAEGLPTYNNAIMGINKMKHENIEKLFYTIITHEAVRDPKTFLDKSIKTSYKPSYGLEFFTNLFNSFKIAEAVGLLNDGSLFTYPHLRIYNSALFDPAWACHQKHVRQTASMLTCYFSDFCLLPFETSDKVLDRFFAGAFTYHIHYQDCVRPVQDSMFYHYKSYFKNTAYNKLMGK